MKATKALLKVELLGFMGINRFIKDKSVRKTGIAYLLLGLLMGIFIPAMSFMIAKIMAEYEMLHIALLMGMIMSSIVIFIFSILKSSAMLIKNNDFDFLMGLPFSKTLIIGVKYISIYLSELVFAIGIMVPMYVVYIMYGTFDVMFTISFFTSLLLIPILPSILGVLLGAVVSFIASKFKYSSIVLIVGTFAGIFTFYYFYFTMMSSMGEINLSFDVVNMIGDYISGFYPPAYLFSEALAGNMLMLLIFAAISLGVLAVSLWLIAKNITSIGNITSAKKNGKKFTTASIKQKSVFNTLLRKEIKQYMSYPTYVINTIIGILLGIGMPIFLLASAGDVVDVLLEIPMIKDMAVIGGATISCMFVGLCCTTASSISIEAKQIWLLKSLPLNHIEIFNGKMALNLLINIPASIVIGLLLGFILKLDIGSVLLVVISPIAFSIFITTFGMYAGVKMAKYDWKNVNQVIKNGAPMIVSQLLPFFIQFAFIAIIVWLGLTETYIVWILTLIYLLMSLFLYMMLNRTEIKS